MKKLNELLDDAKTVTGSDYATAKRMGVTRAAISGYRNGRSRPDAYAVFKLAEVLNLNERDVFIALNVEGEKNEDKRRFWEKLGGVAASFLVGVTFIMTPPPSQAAEAQHMKITNDVYYVK